MLINYMKKSSITSLNKGFWLLNTVPIKIEDENIDKLQLTISYSNTLSEIIARGELDDYENVIKLLLDLITQLEILNKNGYSITFFELEDIVQIDDKFYFISDSKVKKISKNQIVVEEFYEMSFVVPNELRNGQLPQPIYYGSCLFSLAVISLYCLFPKDSFETYENIIGALDKIYGLPLYWSLLRCLNQDENKRYFIYI
jgi:hypothetical protein